MDPAVKIILDEMQQRFSDELRKGFSEHDEKWDHRFLDLEHSQGTRLDRLEDAAQVFDEWRPRIEATVDDVMLELGKVTRFWDRSFCERAVPEPPIFPTPQSAMERLPAPTGADGPNGHRVDPQPQDEGFGSVLIQSHISVKGASSHSSPTLTSIPPRCPLVSRGTIRFSANSPNYTSTDLMATTPASGSLDVRIILRCTLLIPVFGFTLL